MALPPKGYAGTERIVATLTEHLVAAGHEVTLFAASDSTTTAKLESITKSLGLQPHVENTIAESFVPLRHVANCFRQAEKFDIIHSHAQYLGLPFAACVRTPTLHTFHIALSDATPEQHDMLLQFQKERFVSISNAQRIEPLNFAATVYNGVDTSIYIPAKNTKKEFLLWIGRGTEKKGAHLALQTALKLNHPIVLAIKVTDREYYDQHIRPHERNPLVTILHDLSAIEIVQLYQNAKTTLFPILWNEPFGLVPAESMACATPVIAFRRGAIPEVVLDGKTGFVVEPESGVDGLAQAVEKIEQIRPEDCRRHVEDHFSTERMVADYEALYRQYA